MPRVPLSLPEARKILLVQELDRTDLDGDLLSAEEKRSASIRCTDSWSPGPQEAVRLAPSSLQFLRHRSIDILHLLNKGHPDLVREAQWRHEPLRWGPLFLVAAVLTGFLMARLGPGREFNLMALPVLLILVWNFVVVIGAVASWFRPGRQPGQGGPVGLCAWLTAFGADKGGAVPTREGSEPDPVATTKERFLAEFRERDRQLLRPWRRARVAAFLHTAAAALALAGVAGLYHRGWAVEYRAVWESTLLGVDGARTFFGGLFRPAATIFNLPLPLDQLPAMQAGPGREAQPTPALPWLHLYAGTLVLFAVLPRVLLALAEVLRIRRAFSRAVLPPDILDHLRQLAQDLSGQPSVVVVLPYGYDPAPRMRDEVRSLLHELRGLRVAIQYRGPIRYGDEEPCIYFDGEEAAATVLLMNMASTPEDETHGFLVRGLRERRLLAQAGGSLLVLVDAGPFVERLQDLPEFERRLEQRSQVWRETIERAGLRPVFLNLPGQGRADTVAAMRESWWQAPVPAAATSFNPRTVSES